MPARDSEWSNGGTPVETPDESDMDDDLGRGRDVGGSRGRLSMPATPAYGDDDDAASGSMHSSGVSDSDGSEHDPRSPNVVRGRPRGRPRGTRGGRGGGRSRGGGKAKAPGKPARRVHAGEEPGWNVTHERDPDGQLKLYHRTVGDRVYDLRSDELYLDEDAIGNTKIDELGYLKGGREYKSTTFTSPWRPDPTKLYMLSIDAARACGYRDSLYFFRRNKELVKLNLAGSEKEYLIGEGHLPIGLRTRSVTMIAVRNVFKLQGAKMLKNARWVTDDYYEDKAREDCIAKGIEPDTPVGDLPDPNAVIADRRVHEETQASTQRIDKHTPFYTAGGPSTHFPSGSGLEPFVDAGRGNKRAVLLREGLTTENWLFEYAKAASEKNREITQERLARMGSFKHGFMWEKLDESVLPAAAKGAPNGSVKEEPSTSTFPPPPPPPPPPGPPKIRLSFKGKERERSGSVLGASTPVFAPSPLATNPGSAVSPADQCTPADMSIEDEEAAYAEASAAAKAAEKVAAAERKRKRRFGPPLGQYEPHTHIPHVPISMQSTSATFTRLSSHPSFTPFNWSDPLAVADSNPLPAAVEQPFGVIAGIGGERVGGKSWGLASLVYQVKVPIKEKEETILFDPELEALEARTKKEEEEAMEVV